MIKIKDMHPKDENVEFKALVSYVTFGKTNGANKSNYLSITFQDESGLIDAKLWNATDQQMDEICVGSVVHAIGDIIKYNDDRQMKIGRIIDVSYDEQEQVKYLTKAPLSAEEIKPLINHYAEAIDNEIMKKIVTSLLDDHADKYIIYPAASKNHHTFVSGLAFHTVSMLKIADTLLEVYPTLNQDLIYSAILLHDLGKVIELSGPVVPSYTLEGKLLGHISITQSLIYEKAQELNLEGEEVTLLQHMVLSHHGKLEYGSPILPQIKEAEIVYLIDNIDARMNMFDKALENIEYGEYSKRIFSLENRMVYKPLMYKKTPVE